MSFMPFPPKILSKKKNRDRERHGYAKEGKKSIAHTSMEH
jgi:hypothetical protein